MSDEAPPPGDIDALRARLRALGYLDAPVDRFVLGGASDDAASLAIQTSLRIGGLTGLLLGPSAVVGLATRAPGLITRPMDAVVLAVYLAVPFALGAALLAAAASVAGAWLARRSAGRAGLARHTRRAATSTGLLAAAACLVYLTFWWQAAVPAGNLAAQAIALVVATAVALVLGHGVTISILAMAVRAGVPDLPPGPPLSSWRVLAPLGLVAIAGGWGILGLSSNASHTPPAPPPLTVVPTGVRVIAVAIDGADASTLTQLTSRSVLPTFSRWSTGATGRLNTGDDRDPARVWTTIATGQPPERHGVRALEGRQVAGVEGQVAAERPSLLTTATDLVRLTRPTIVSGDQRRVPTFWEVAARAGLRTAVVHWWATWPASPQDGIVLSDRALLRLEQGGPLAGEIAPAALYEELVQSRNSRQEQVDEWLQALDLRNAGTTAETASRSAALDAAIVALATDPALGELDLLTVYLPGLDILTHGLPAGADHTPLVEAYYRYLDVLLGHLMDLQTSSPSTALVLITHPGRTKQGAAGVFAVAGPMAADVDDVPVGTEAVAPTVLRLLGVPVAEDLPGRPTGALLTDSFRQANAGTSVTTYGERRQPASAPGGRALDKEMVERMRSLGYVR